MTAWHYCSIINQDKNCRLFKQYFQPWEEEKTLMDLGLSSTVAKPQSPYTIGLTFRLEGLLNVVTYIVFVIKQFLTKNAGC